MSACDLLLPMSDCLNLSLWNLACVSCCYQTPGHLLAVYGSASLCLQTSMCFLERGLLGCGLVRSIITGHCLLTFSLACPAKSEYCIFSLLSWSILVLKYRFIFNYSSAKIRKDYTILTCSNPQHVSVLWTLDYRISSFMEIISYGHKHSNLASQKFGTSIKRI